MLLSSISFAKANSAKYLCAGDEHYFYILFNKEKRSVLVGNSSSHQYFVQTDFIYWHTNSYTNNDTLVQSYIFHKPSGKMSVKRHKFITNEEMMYFYQCDLIQ